MPAPIGHWQRPRRSRLLTRGGCGRYHLQSRFGSMAEMTETLVKHVALPALASVAVVALYYTPLSVIGCATRGLIALGIVGAALVVAVVVALLGVRMRARDGDVSVWSLVSVGILVLPALLVIGPLA
jgi:hypothetical protein